VRLSWSLLPISILGIAGGCATTPNVSEKMDKAPASAAPRQLLSAGGLLSPETSKAIMEGLGRTGVATDLLERQSVVTEAASGAPLTTGNRVTLLVDGAATYAAMLRAIESARQHVNLESFIIEDDETGRKFSELLLKKRSEGVDVNLIYDSQGSWKTAAPFFDRLRAGGIEVVEFDPPNPLKGRGKWGVTHRDHRKILVVDGKVAILGGVNISQLYSSGPSRKSPDTKGPGPIRDTDVQIEGPAVAECQKLFLETWKAQKGPPLQAGRYLPASTASGEALVRIVGSTPGQANRTTFVVYVSAITYASHSIHLTNAYFVPDAQILKAFTDAARRGVDVKLLVPSVTDSELALNAQRYYYADLLEAGVKVYEFRTAMLHAKTAVIDEVWSTVGSSNLDYWSFVSNDEVNAVILSREFAVELEQVFARDLEKSNQILREDWKERPLVPRLAQWIAHLFFLWL
jgi:cardiolipin synthase